jgi:hypothetical protein
LFVLLLASLQQVNFGLAQPLTHPPQAAQPLLAQARLMVVRLLVRLLVLVTDFVFPLTEN